jgi:hypothetical protein
MNTRIQTLPEPAYYQLRAQLDDCLNSIEAAIERGNRIVSEPLAGTLIQFMPSVRNGMPLAEALNVVFASQEKLFSVRSSKERRSNGPGAACGGHRTSSRRTDLTKAEALDLTGQIRQGLDELPLLLLQAHERRAWIPLGHHSWDQYVRAEFRLSRSRSYELLNQARVIRTLRSAAGGRLVRPVSALAAIEIKPFLTEVAEDVRRGLDGVAGDSPLEEVDTIVRRVVAQARTRARKPRCSPSSWRGGPATGAAQYALSSTEEASAARNSAADRIGALVEAVTLLADQPAVEGVLDALTFGQFEELRSLPSAARWLAEFAALWSSRRSIGGEHRTIPHTRATPSGIPDNFPGHVRLASVT